MNSDERLLLAAHRAGAAAALALAAVFTFAAVVAALAAALAFAVVLTFAVVLALVGIAIFDNRLAGARGRGAGFDSESARVQPGHRGTGNHHLGVFVHVVVSSLRAFNSAGGTRRGSSKPTRV